MASTKERKYLNLIKELEDAGYKAVEMSVEVDARGFITSSVYDLMTELSTCGNKRTKAATGANSRKHFTVELEQEKAEVPS